MQRINEVLEYLQADEEVGSPEYGEGTIDYAAVCDIRKMVIILKEDLMTVWSEIESNSPATARQMLEEILAKR